MGDTTTATIELFDQLTAPRPELCRATGLHDRASGGLCRDCGKTLAASDDIASTCRLDQMPGSRHLPRFL